MIAMALLVFKGALAVAEDHVDVPAPKASLEVSAPKEKAPAPKETTPAPAEPFVRVLDGSMTLTVVDVDAFLQSSVVQKSLQASVANLLGLPTGQVKIETMAAKAASLRRRLKSESGNVIVKYHITDPTKTVTPAKVSSIAMMLPASVNNQLNAQSQLGNTFVTTANIPAPTLETTTSTTTTVTTTTVTTVVNFDPCAAVAPVAVAPVAAGWKDPQAKFSKVAGKTVERSPAASWVPGMLCLALPAFIGLAVIVRSVAQRRPTRSLGAGSCISSPEVTLDCEAMGDADEWEVE